MLRVLNRSRSSVTSVSSVRQQQQPFLQSVRTSTSITKLLDNPFLEITAEWGKNEPHPNLANSNLRAFPTRKRNTILHFGQQGHMYVVKRFGRLCKVKGPGLFFTLPYVDEILCVDMRKQVFDVARQTTYTVDNVRIQVAAQLHLIATDPVKVCFNSAEPLVNIMSKAQSVLRVENGKRDLDHLLKERNEINKEIQLSMEADVNDLGIRVELFEITDLTPDARIQEAMDLQSTAERKRRAQVIEADGVRKALELEAEGKRNSAIMEAEGRQKAAILEAEGMRTSAQSMTTVTPKLMEYFLALKYYGMIGSIMANNRHATYFVPKDITALPATADILARGNQSVDQSTQQPTQLIQQPAKDEDSRGKLDSIAKTYNMLNQEVSKTIKV